MKQVQFCLTYFGRFDPQHVQYNTRPMQLVTKQQTQPNVTTITADIDAATTAPHL